MDDINFEKRKTIEQIEESTELAPKFDENGMIPVVTTDYDTGEVLMQGYMNEEAFKKTIKIRPYWIESRYNLAETYQLSNQLENSITEYIELKKIKTDDPNIDFSISCLYKKMGKTEEAVRYMISGWRLFEEKQMKISKLKSSNLDSLADLNISKLSWSPIILFSPYIPNCN